MMKKTIIFMMLSLFLFSFNGTAQNKNKKETFSWNKKYMNQLEFNEDLQGNILKIDKEFKEKNDLVRNDVSLSPEDKKEKIKKLNKQKNNQINGLLSPDEKKRTIALKKELSGKKEK